MGMIRKMATFFLDTFEGASMFKPLERLEIYETIFNYMFYDKAPNQSEVKPQTYMAFRGCKQAMDNAKERYDKSISCGEFGKFGGAPKGNQNAKKQTENNPVEEKKTTETTLNNPLVDLKQPKTTQESEEESESELEIEKESECVKDESVREESQDEPAPSIHLEEKKIKHKYGKYKHVLLTDEQYQSVLKELGQPMLDDCITFLDNYCEANGKSYKNYAQTIRNWVINAVKERSSKGNSTKVEVATKNNYGGLR